MHTHIIQYMYSFKMFKRIPAGNALQPSNIGRCQLYGLAVHSQQLHVAVCLLHTIAALDACPLALHAQGACKTCLHEGSTPNAGMYHPLQISHEAHLHNFSSELEGNREQTLALF